MSMRPFTLFFLCTILVASCSGTKPPPLPPTLTTEPPAFVVRVQSSYGDLQQVEVSVKQWLINGEDQRQFDKKTTPFDIPVAAGEFFLHLRGPQGAPKIMMQLLKGESGMMVSYVQSSEVCARSNTSGGFELQDCMVGMR